MAQPEALAYFEQAKRDEPMNKQCFECDQPHPMWCDLWHAVYLCLGCSGKHRGLGTHISFVRSLNMDRWSDEHLDRMKAGGNGKAKRFFQSRGVADLPFHEKWNSDPAFMYKDMMEAVSKGQTFNEASWVPPPRTQRTAAAPPANARPDPAAAGAGRYQGMGSMSNKPAQETDVMGALTSGWSMLSSTVSAAAQTAAQKSKELASQAQEKDWSSSTAKAQQQAAAGWASLATVTKTGWGSLASWATKAVGAEEEEDGLSSMLTKMDINKGTNYEGLSNPQAPPPQQREEPRATTSPQDSKADGWDDWKDDENDWGSNSTAKPAAAASPVRTTTASGGASLNAMRRKPAAGGKKAE